MLELINSKDLKTDVDLVCTYCGKEHSLKDSKENKDYVFERDSISQEEWCICVECKRKCDNQ